MHMDECIHKYAYTLCMDSSISYINEITNPKLLDSFIS